tara:strand:- start:1019 stop:2200 length:1182 start_codon:yes stop_codon:yes gene_type:complete
MAEENKEVLEEVTEATEESVDEKVEEVTEEVADNVDLSKFKSADNPDVIKVDLDATVKKEETEEENKEEVVEETKEVIEEVVDQPVVEETVEQELVEEEKQVEEVVEEVKQDDLNLPDNIQKLVEFMDETGGSLEDYVNLNRDVSKMDNSDVLDEYYRATKSHLTAEERGFLLEETFGYDEEEDDPKDIKRKKIALKEQVAEARAYLDGQKSKYYKDIKAESKLTSEQQKAIDFFNRYNKDSEEQEKISQANKKTFLDKTNNLFNDKFKGFEYNVGDKRYRFNIKDVNKVKETQSDLNNFVNKFVGKDKTTIEDTTGYHKSLFTAMNADAIAKHFYEQGKADAVKDRVARDKNINLEPRKTHGEVNVGGVKYKVLGSSSSDIKNRSFKIRKKN